MTAILETNLITGEKAILGTKKPRAKKALVPPTAPVIETAPVETVTKRVRKPMSEEAKEKRRIAAAAKKLEKELAAAEEADQALEDAVEAEIQAKEAEMAQKKAEQAAKRKAKRDVKIAEERAAAGKTQLPVEQVELEPSITIKQAPKKKYFVPDEQVFKQSNIKPVIRIGNYSSTANRKRYR